MKRSREKELQTGVANLGCKKELETGIAERSCQPHLQKDDEKALDDDEAGNTENNLFGGSSVGLFLATVLLGIAFFVVLSGDVFSSLLRSRSAANTNQI